MKTAVIAVLGGLLTLAGIALLVLPGPGFVLVAAGLAVLATRFAWARKPLDYAKDKAQEGVEEVAKRRARGAPPERCWPPWCSSGSACSPWSGWTCRS